MPTPIDITAFLTASLTLLNLADEAVDVSIDLSDEDTGSGTVAKLHLEPFDGLAESIPAGTYVVAFTRASAPTKPVTCGLVLEDGDEFHFAVFATVITIVTKDTPATSRDDLLVGSSPLCAA